MTKKNPGIKPINQDWQNVDARILGQILAAQNILFVLPDEKRISEYFSQALSIVPGIEFCFVCLENMSAPPGDQFKDCKTCDALRKHEDGSLCLPRQSSCKLAVKEDIRTIAIKTNEHTFGFLIFQTNLTTAFEPYWPFICNLAFFIAISLENRLQKRLLETAYNVLEEKVNTRTEELKLINERFSLASNSAKLGVWDWNIQKNELVWDDRMYTLYGIRKDDFSGAYEAWLNGVHPEDRAACNEISRLALLGELEYNTEFRIIWPDGSIHHMEAHAQIIRDTEGNPLRMTGVNFEITQRKEADSAIFEGQQVFRTLVENSPDIIARYDLNCRRTYVNPVYVKVAQIPQEELISTAPIQRSPLPESSAVILQNLLRRVLDSRVAEAVDLIWPKADNTDYWYNVYAFPEFARDGKVVSVMTISRDITDRKRSEKHIQKINRIYAVLSNINETIFRVHDINQLLNETCRITVEEGKFQMAWIGLVNNRTNKVDVIASHGVIGDYLEKINIDLNDDVQSNGPAGIAAKTGKYKISNNILLDDDFLPWRDNAIKYDYKSVASFPLKAFHKIVGVFLIYSNEVNFFSDDDIKLLDETAMDISFAIESIENETERKRIEENLIKAKAKAEESDHLKTAFLHNISHEIRTPMNAIMGFSSLLVDNYNDKPKLEHFAEIINQRCEDLLIIINGILEIAKIESGQMPVNNEECDLEILFTELTQFFHEHQNHIGKQQIDFKLKSFCKPGEIKIMTDKIKLKEIFINLISNAFKFTDKGKIEGGCHFVKNDKLVFYVSDTGIGIPHDKHNQIFDRFYQVPQLSISRLNEGNGLGLSIVKGFVQLLGGEIWLESELDKGTTFYFTIPYKTSKILPQEPLKIDEPATFHFQNKTILIVEDDQYNADFIKEILSDTGANVLHTIYGSEAIQIAANQSLDIILMDIRLPDISGYEVTLKIKQLNPNIKIIAQTAYAAHEDNKKATDAGCIDYISKPSQRNLLLSMLNKHLLC